MRKLLKAGLVVGACLLLGGCPRATSVSGLVTSGWGVANETIVAGATLGPARTYHVDDGASITVTYDNGKTCTFRGPTDFVPGADGSVCEKKDNDDKKQDDNDQEQDQKQEQKPQDQSEAGQGQDQGQGQASNGGGNPTPGSSAPAATPTAVPDHSGIGGPQATATAVPTYTRIMSVLTNPVVSNTLAAIGAISVANEIRKQTDGNGDEPISK